MRLRGLQAPRFAAFGMPARQSLTFSRAAGAARAARARQRGRGRGREGGADHLAVRRGAGARSRGVPALCASLVQGFGHSAACFALAEAPRLRLRLRRRRRCCWSARSSRRRRSGCTKSASGWRLLQRCVAPAGAPASAPRRTRAPRLSDRARLRRPAPAPAAAVPSVAETLHRSPAGPPPRHGAAAPDLWPRPAAGAAARPRARARALGGAPARRGARWRAALASGRG